MRNNYTNEEVTLIENKSFEVGLDVGIYKERKRILAVLKDTICNCTEDCNRIDTTFDELKNKIEE